MKSLKISKNTKQILLLTAGVLLFRIIYIDLYNQLKSEYSMNIVDSIKALLQDYVSLIMMIVCTSFCTIKIAKNFQYGQYPAKRTLILLLLVILISIFTSFTFNRNIFFTKIDYNAAQSRFFIAFLASLLINIIIAIAIDVGAYFYKSRRELKAEKDKKHKAQYQYTQLKQQLNPHFLINSLSMLDFLVKENNNKRASAFIKKLADVYRYMLSTEKERLVSVDEELKFIDSYTSLLKERFVESLFIDIKIDDVNRRKLIVPCGLQILVENATKHNIVNKQQPLYIKIFVENNAIVTTNNLQPRIRVQSTGIGLQNLAKQYADLSDENIRIEKNDTEFKVSLPLINDD